MKEGLLLLLLLLLPLVGARAWIWRWLWNGGTSGMSDPAYPAHVAPMGHWAMAIWYSWLPLTCLQKPLAAARMRLAFAIAPWLTVKGLAAAFGASAARRLKWTVLHAINVATDSGTPLNLSVDAPEVLTREVVASVRRWRWRNVEREHSSLDSGGKGSGVHMEPVWKALNSMFFSSWNGSHKGMVVSAITNRQ